MNPYQVRQVDSEGDVLAETQVLAHNYDAVLRQLNEVPDATKRIEVYNHDGEKAGEANVSA